MDPNTALQTLREQAKDLTRDSDYADAADVQEVVEQFEALDEWLSKGGFAPAAWGGPTGTVSSTREVPADEVKALVTIEAVERLINRARRALEEGRTQDTAWALLLLEQAAALTTERTCTAVKSQALSDEISLKADDLVAPAVKKARAVQAVAQGREPSDG